MSYKISLDDPDLKLDIVCSTAGLQADAPTVIELLKLAREFDRVVPLRKIILDQEPSGDFGYEFTALDGRKWNQIIRADSPDVLMNFDVPDFWRLSEFVLHRAIRDLMVIAIAAYKIEKIMLNWKGR